MAKLVLSVRPNMAALYTFQAIRTKHPFTTNYSSIHTLALGLGVSRQRGRLLNPIGNVSGSELGSCGRRGSGLGRIGVRASSTYHVNESGSIDSPLIKSMEIKLLSGTNSGFELGRRRRSGIRASSTYHVNESGSIDSPLIKSMEIKKLQLNEPCSFGSGVNRHRGLGLNPIGTNSGSGLGISGIRASSTHHVNESGSIDSPLIKSIEIKIKEQLNAESVIVKDAYGDGRHVSIDVISSGFEGQSAVQRQRMVYKAIWEELQNTVHAVDQMTTKTPAEAGTSK